KKTKVTKRAEIQIRILALNFYMWKRFTGQQYFDSLVFPLPHYILRWFSFTKIDKNIEKPKLRYKKSAP
ncbi:hypothetical protein, partial [Prevotella intermedia]|uniref:hypothetical protein n=1 Tax=Prevotella intermedia TaxID=28131 RepID=UPI001E630C02